MRKVVLFIAQSLDGYIATKEDSLDWLFSVEGEGDNGYAEFFSTVDTILMGKRTYDWVMQQENGAFPYPDKQCYVFSNAQNEDTEYVRFINGDIRHFITDLKKEEGKDIWVVGGGNLLQPFFKEGLVDEMKVTVAPKVIGDGIPLFKKGDYQLDLSLIGSKTFNQFVELHYTVVK
ncbi:dihydrofolate reductase family protein [Jeotgalibacillus sp. ET6]|uniref:dihydrofolate reductase family protein n=1 Tax=Jeotgalibacillus sp. ET6 TaxID=3037260 RepID=UPI002418239C|nr:dihydrofolate reductase family protein [Jeotgalibacillus sp. ET6]MDG5471468.1 dihydrofolate reductase family protein [Jeotgalibacillus sp. ET6]